MKTRSNKKLSKFYKEIILLIKMMIKIIKLILLEKII